MNMEILKPSRKRPRAGDVFAFRMPDRLHRYGRLMRTDATIRFFKDCTLIYIYRVATREKIPAPRLLREDILLPPMCTNFLPWSRGYLETLESRPICADDRLPVHCFWDSIHLCYMDDDNHVLDERHEPCGEYGLHSFRTIDDEISKALGIPLAPD